MAQFARPSVDSSIGGYKDQADGTTNIYASTDEVSPNDADYIKSALAPSNAPYVTKLSAIEDPQSSSGHVVRYRYAKNAAGGAQIDLTVQLRQGYANEGSPGTLIKEWTHANIGETLTTQNQTLSGAEADSITNYADLFLRFVANQV
jgi:hypothetical protein